MLKRRYRGIDGNNTSKTLEYFNHPFEVGNNIRLVDDFDLPESLSLDSLSSSFIPASANSTEGRGRENATERPVKEKKNQFSLDISDDDYSPFDMDKAINY
jgi:hypothetical protein